MRSTLTAALQATVAEAGARIVDRTPVDTGLLRGNWQLSTGLVGEVLDRLDPDGSAAKSEIQADAQNLELGQRVAIVNSLDYAAFVEYGTSKMPPAAMVGVTATEVGDIFFSELRGAVSKAA